MLAFKSTSVTRCTKTLPHQIEWHSSGQNRRDPTERTIAQIDDLEPNNIMGERYKMKIRVTEVVSTNDWWYMECRDCWKKVKIEGDTYKCPRCPNYAPLPRFRILLNAVDADVVDVATAPMAQFTFFGPRGETIVGRDAVMVVANARGQANYVPPELAGLVGRKFVVTVTPSDKSLDADYKHYQVQEVEPLQEEPPSEQTSTVETVDQPSASSDTTAQTNSAVVTASPPSVQATPPSNVLWATEKSSTTKDTGKRGAQQLKQDKQKKGRTARELEYPAEE